MAIAATVKHFHHYLHGCKFLIRTDHGALHWLLNFKNPEGQMTRWLEVLSAYNFEIQHRPGKQNLNADGLSRRPCIHCTHCNHQEVKESANSELDNSLCHVRATIITVENMLGEELEVETAKECNQWEQSKHMKEIADAKQNDEVIKTNLETEIRG